jgi:hypothetical protein
MIDWAAFLTVAAAALVSTAVVVSLYSFGLRLQGLTRPDPATGEPVHPAFARVLAYLCFGLTAVAVLFGIYLIVPFLHG